MRGFGKSRATSLAAYALSILILYLLLIQPSTPQAMTASALLAFPLELPLLLILFALIPERLSFAPRALITFALTIMALLRLADIGMYLAYLRPFNPALDMALLPAGWRIMSGTVGTPMTLTIVIVLILNLLVLTLLVWWATGQLARFEPPRLRRGALLLALLPAVLFPILDFREPEIPGSTMTTRLSFEHLRDAVAARGDLQRFRREAAQDFFAALPPDQVLPGLRGTDIFVVFVESYGRSALENPIYAPTITATLRQAQTRLAATGLAMRSAWLTAPMIGGQSWLAHGSLLSGLPVNTEGRYRALIASPRETLARIAQTAGWRNVAVMPAIVYAWPEAAYFGYDQILTESDLGYRGKPFNWVTMPDQFTLASFERQSLDVPNRAPVFAEIALISSHAPWTPVPSLLPWDELGDGRIFDAQAVSGDAPDIVWRDRDRVRDQYRQSLDYSLRTVAAFARRRASHPTLMIVLGDHQPARFVSGDHGGRDVPVHVIGAPDTLARLEGWGWTQGLIPRGNSPVWPMEAFRDRFLTAFATKTR